MSSLNKQDFEVLLDYSLGMASDAQNERAEKLLAENEDAIKLLECFTNSIAPLEHFHFHQCPDHLVETTVSKLNHAARSSQLKLQELITAEQTKKPLTNPRFWRNMGEILSAAAILLFISGVVISPLRYARHQSWQQNCKNQLAGIARGMDNYMSDNQGQMPAMATAAGDPWWKVGYQGRENHSNTRQMWVLVKNGYVDVGDFVCPGKREGRAIQFDPAKVKDYNDFPARRYITYSFRIPCKNMTPATIMGKKVLIADLNPLFEKIPGIANGKLGLKPNTQLMRINSRNHNLKGQNVLFDDGSASFNRTRQAELSHDDIFTLQNTTTYQGCELPSSPNDVFLAP